MRCRFGLRTRTRSTSLVPLRVPAVDGWFGFNSLAAARGLWPVERAAEPDTVVYWCVDFVPDRFGRGPITRAYDALDRLCCRRADARFELSQAALEGTRRRHGIPAGRARPGAGRADGRLAGPRADDDREGHTSPSRRLPRPPGAAAGRRAAPRSARAARRVEGDVIGRGPLEQELRDEAERLGSRTVRFHGFVEDYREVERLLARASIAVAPYEPDPETRSRASRTRASSRDTSAAGLPILLTDVPPNARDLERSRRRRDRPLLARGTRRAIERSSQSPGGVDAPTRGCARTRTRVRLADDSSAGARPRSASVLNPAAG